ncbi:unnamed protein product [Anisakis simplex]|uniref:Large ribosomal subunit protein P2 n=1 Tax=Anisakis simplex TaxID=6269 RepID=A0A0M3JS03_ANISI|nr:unnamed protein product [Anisakis simplex]
MGAYLLAALGGNQSPTAKDIEHILASVGLDVDMEDANKVVSALSGKSVEEVISAGITKIGSVPSGGGGGAAAAPAAATAKKEEPQEESEDEDMGFGFKSLGDQIEVNNARLDSRQIRTNFRGARILSFYYKGPPSPIQPPIHLYLRAILIVKSGEPHNQLREHLFHMLNLSARQIIKWILRNTTKSTESLTPEIVLRLITDVCPMWMATPDQCPLPDPYWAFYWPGGQALTRFVLDNRNMFVGKKVLDFGAGCGATSIAAVWSEAEHVLVNDIDISAILASRLNFKVNRTSHSHVTFSNLNLLHPANAPIWSNFISGQKTFVLLGDMFYDVDFARIVLKWLQKVQNDGDITILIGDPDRYPLTDQNYRQQIGIQFRKRLLHEYALPGYITKQHYGFTSAKVFQIDLL